ncbi:transcriptional regulator, AraC family [Fibrisoma limi BUZ 3]|uniref:Transcriptional regulator, AraC family n=1 Tax=Fibrisoma limi BUZ 3 TaxID=1185876 RepID=I2GI70_9BACT|nr:helix-turn-helix domain-containing protein [Fibrisoma limi]CCH53595.1 transcriptional regulator, AraC family [Fibrisoma limi BUZ 3]
MICQDFLPGPALQPYVKRYHLRHFVFADMASIPFKPYAPRPEQTLAFYPRGRELVEHIGSHRRIERPRSMLMGQYVERTNRHLSGSEFIVFLVEFYPGVLYRITGIPYYELTNTFVDAEAIFSKEMRLVNERLNSTDNYPEMITIVETFLHQLVRTLKRDSHPIDTIARLIIERPESPLIRQLAADACLCPRQFERKFNERMGVNPKLFSRIARLHNAYRSKYNRPQNDWLSIALACGYHDYQHLVKDFQRFAGVTPTTYAAEDNNAPERLFGLSDSSYA